MTLRDDSSKSRPLANSVRTTVDVGSWTTDFDEADEDKYYSQASPPVADVSMPTTSREETWRSHPISMFRDKYRGQQPGDRKLPTNVRQFYKNQDKLIQDLQSTLSLLNTNEEEDLMRHAAARKQYLVNNILIKVAFFLNLLLLIGKMAASILSHSLSIISSLMESAVDLASGFTLWFTAYQMRKSLPYTYPTGRKRLEPIAVIILSAIMGSISVQIMIGAAQTIYNMAVNDQGPPRMTDVTIGLVASTIAVKVGLFVACWKFGRGESIAALKNDQLNDSISNSVALVFSTLSARIEGIPCLKYLDPSGALLIGIYIVYSWWKMGAEHTRNLTGHSADPVFLQRITFICVNHHPLIERLDTVRAFHLGNNYMVEVDIVLPRNLDLHKAHDIGETLQQKLESLEEVERAFVHLDYEVAHHPQSEHKMA
uniref:ZT_dimer domain-containing protein n=2 Tax=Mesocestoides corti TaxID=53468 RepID=A0A5K3F6T8_MESCO